MNAIEQAYALAEKGDPASAVETLEKAGRAGDADSWVELGLWYLQGRILPRDLSLTRTHFGKAAGMGNAQAQMIYLSLLANGTGGPADWPTALGLLDAMALENPDAARQLDLIAVMDLDASGDPLSAPTGEVVSEAPHAVLFPKLLTNAECTYLIDLATPRLKPAVVIDPATGAPRLHPVRTSESAGFPLIMESPFVHAINRRIACASGSHVDCGEPLQVLRYRPGQEYKPHHDGLEGEANQRIMTMLVYLNAEFTGGETAFLKTGLKIRGDRGDALLFRNATDDGQPDPNSLHAGLPVSSGEKLIASRWIRQYPFGPKRG